MTLLAAEPADSRRRVFLWAPPYLAEWDLENTQSTTDGSDCSFEPQRYHRDGFSGTHHFPQLVVLLGLPWAFAVIPGLRRPAAPLRREWFVYVGGLAQQAGPFQGFGLLFTRGHHAGGL